jgi:thiamine biosynthesis lipoprotein ApbE
VHSVSVAAERCMIADAGATTVFGTDAEEARRLLVSGSAGADLVHLS